MLKVSTSVNTFISPMRLRLRFWQDASVSWNLQCVLGALPSRQALHGLHGSMGSTMYVSTKS